MNRRKTSAALVVVLALTLVLPVAVGAGKPPAFQATHVAEIVGDHLSADNVLVEQQKSGRNFHTNPYWVYFPLHVGAGFFDCDPGMCPGEGTYNAFFSITQFERGGPWTLYIMIHHGDWNLRLETEGTLEQVKKMRPFTFTPDDSRRLDVYSPATSIGVLIGTADQNFTIVGEVYND